MDEHVFVYSVDTITSSGEYEMAGMILDHEELREVIRDAENSGSTLTSVTVTMYDQRGEMVGERDITRLFVYLN